MDLTPFFSGPISLDPAQSSGLIDLFTVEIPAGTQPGSYAGSFTVLGGLNGDAQDIVGSAAFSVTVRNQPASVPEPVTWALTGAALLAALVAFRDPKRL